ncbi:hypothetical protein DK926_09270 [Rhodococcus sp. Eu-32]|nr:hypothetical protein DK926_09270 [Rhodococcus sp. Eu-32]
MNPMDPAVAYWNSLSDAAESGQLYLSPEAARKCDYACTDFLSKLSDHQLEAGLLADVKGLGSLPSGISLATRFSEKAAGGPNNLVDVLQSHIDVVMAMQAVFRKFFTDTADTDRENASGISAQGPR